MPTAFPQPISAAVSARRRRPTVSRAASRRHPISCFCTRAQETTKVDAESFYHLDKGDVFEIYQSGGGGYGDPHKRPAEKVREDVVNGLISVAKARELYGVVIDAGNQTLDTAGTMAARRS